jgi:3-deoxy-D-manno-octulosonate 8-phosphate phosphatase KdsC-like HAD superfamily phosphatase
VLALSLFSGCLDSIIARNSKDNQAIEEWLQNDDADIVLITSLKSLKIESRMTVASLRMTFCFSNKSKNLMILGKKLILMATPFSIADGQTSGIHHDP